MNRGLGLFMCTVVALVLLDSALRADNPPVTI